MVSVFGVTADPGLGWNAAIPFGVAATRIRFEKVWAMMNVRQSATSTVAPSGSWPSNSL